jgi:NAD(P)-dependent dehydrogenase (short-subunit alcohol dehydrogenase family)
MTNEIAKLFSLEGKAAVITGASRGIGEEIARVFALAGARVVMNSRKEKGISEAADKIKANGGEALPVVANVSSSEDRKKLIDASMEWAGRIDILVNNAGTNPAFAPLEEVEESAWDKTFAVNLNGPFFLSQLAYHAWMKKNGGSIINTSSAGGFGTALTMNVYNVTKAALIHLTKCLASEWKNNNVRVNALAPGLIKTRLSQLLWDGPGAMESGGVGLGEVGDIAGTALLLASDAGSFINGQTVIIDGGVLLG